MADQSSATPGISSDNWPITDKTNDNHNSSGDDSEASHSSQLDEVSVAASQNPKANHHKASAIEIDSTEIHVSDLLNETNADTNNEIGNNDSFANLEDFNNSNLNLGKSKHQQHTDKEKNSIQGKGGYIPVRGIVQPGPKVITKQDLEKGSKAIAEAEKQISNFLMKEKLNSADRTKLRRLKAQQKTRVHEFDIVVARRKQQLREKGGTGRRGSKTQQQQNQQQRQQRQTRS